MTAGRYQNEWHRLESIIKGVLDIRGSAFDVRLAQAERRATLVAERQLDRRSDPIFNFVPGGNIDFESSPLLPVGESFTVAVVGHNKIRVRRPAGR
jgi:hypothetical protein